ncbi:STAS-like domain-containing protein [Cellulosimicrobium cellulans]|uniref:STAS-like domain-containing protein n=1 Tax=Cellulosimicrobium cellulans TaxID=1710 RepID=UPI003C6D5FDB
MTKVFQYAGAFAGDKDAAARLRDEALRPRLLKGRRAILDFDKVELATQSFIHALLAAIVREDPSRLEKIDFKHCNDDIQSVIEIVVEYAQEEF